MGKLTDALKAVFGSNKTTGTYVPLVTQAGAPDGNISMANLASVLGVNDMNGKIVHVTSSITSFVIPKHSYANNDSAAQGILFIARNGSSSTPTIYICKRNALVVLYQGSVNIENSVTFAENGDMTVSKAPDAHIYYRMFVME